MMDLQSYRSSILKQTEKSLEECKRILSELSPADFLGAGVHFISLAAKQRFWESIEEGNNVLGWSQIENFVWLIKHQREVHTIWQYCKCVNDLKQYGAPVEVIQKECASCDPEVQVGSSILVSEGLRQLWGFLNS